MSTILPFKGIRPINSLVSSLSCPPYDVINSKEARTLRTSDSSFLRITRAEVDFDESVDEHDPRVYQKSKENYMLFKNNGYLVQDDRLCFYIYKQNMDVNTQIGIVAVASCDEYDNGIIKQHELTRADKEEDRVKHIDSVGANTEPVFFTYRHNKKIDDIVSNFIRTHNSEFSFSIDGVTHTLWKCDDSSINNEITNLFKNEVDFLYVADGHHRSAAASKVRKLRKARTSSFTGKEEFNYFLTVCFPDNQMNIMPYNRLVKDLNGLDEASFLEKISKNFDIKKVDLEFKVPSNKNFCMYLNGNSYLLTAKEGSYDKNDPVKSLDASILQDNLLAPILGIKDPRTDKRIDFAGGIKPFSFLKEKVDSKEFSVCFVLYPVSMEQIIKTADAGKIMPPKSTWFEPKLRSGLFIHEF